MLQKTFVSVKPTRLGMNQKIPLPEEAGMTTPIIQIFKSDITLIKKLPE